jgi:hypothetical protein
LSVIFPLETTELVGGQSLRVTVSLVDRDGQPAEGATVQAELQAPNGDVFATLRCADKGQGRYLADYVRLPLRGTGGTWHVVAQATLEDGERVQGERTFRGISSPSETYQCRYGFWIEPPRLFGYNLADYGLPDGGLHLEDWPYGDGGGYVILDNYRYNKASATFADLDVHWRQADFPTDKDAATAHVQSLASLYRQDPGTPVMGLAAEPATFQSRPAWRVTGQWKALNASRPTARYPVEWVVFRCPDSDWLWTLVISTDNATYMNDLRAVRETFECPISEETSARQRQPYSTMAIEGR